MQSPQDFVVNYTIYYRAITSSCPDEERKNVTGILRQYILNELQGDAQYEVNIAAFDGENTSIPSICTFTTPSGCKFVYKTITVSCLIVETV